MKSAREFWISYDRPGCTVLTAPHKDAITPIHVIEYTEIERLNKLLDEAVKTMLNARCDADEFVTKHINDTIKKIKADRSGE